MKKWQMLVAGLLFSAFGGVGSAHAYSWYTGITGTNKVAHDTYSYFTMYERPTSYCYDGASCFSWAWTSLVDEGATNKWVKGGIGYRPGQCSAYAPVALFYAWNYQPEGVTVGCVPLGTEVLVYMHKNDGQTYVTVYWQYNGITLSRIVDTPNWLNGNGTHPTKVEVYSRYGTPPFRVKFRVRGTMIYSQDWATLTPQVSPPYNLLPGSIWQDFWVSN